MISLVGAMLRARWSAALTLALLALFATACLGVAFKVRPLLPFASNLSFLFVCFLAYAWYFVGAPAQAASEVWAQKGKRVICESLPIWR